MGKIKIGIIGTGSFGRWYAKNCQVDLKDEVQLVGVCNRTENSCKYLFEKNKPYTIKTVPIFFEKNNIENFLEQANPEAVAMAIPPESNLEVGSKILDAGKHLLVEKPMALTIRDCKQLVDHKKEGSILMVAQLLRFEPGTIYLKKHPKLLKGTKSIKIEWKGFIPTKASESKEAKSRFDKMGVIFDYGSHTFDLVRHLFNTEFDDEIDAKADRIINDHEHSAVINASISNIPVTMELEWLKGNNKEDLRRILTLEKDNGNVVLDYNQHKILVNGEEKYDYDKLKAIELREEIRYFINCIKNKKEPETVTAVDGIKAVALCRKALAVA